MVRFPPNFLYGAATSAHQVEGNTVLNDWWKWEADHHDLVPSRMAADHYNKFREDFILARDLGHTAHRLSLEWSRIELSDGEWNRAAVEHYRSVLEELKRLGLCRFVTLHHFTNPLWFARSGGWMSGEAPEHFARYVRFIAQYLGDLVDAWVTINEPIVYATVSYWQKRWPPGHRNIVHVERVLRHMAQGHVLAYRALKNITPHVPVGIAKHCIAYVPNSPSKLDHLGAKAHSWWFNHRFFSLTGNTHDFIGINYYFRKQIHVQGIPPLIRTIPWTGTVSDLGWPIAPQGLEAVLREMSVYRRPIYVTECGVASADDSQRGDFIRSHIRAVERAQSNGADIRGFFYWSLLDTFEWDLGFKPRFGLIGVDYATQARTPRPSAYVYKAIIDQAKAT